MRSTLPLLLLSPVVQFAHSSNGLVNGLLDWLTQRGAMISQAVAIERLPAYGGYGVVAVEALRAQQVVARLPLTLVINVEHVFADTYSRALRTPGNAAELDALSDLDVMSLFVQYEVQAQGGHSRWFPWFRMLPHEGRDGPGLWHPLVWNTSEAWVERAYGGTAFREQLSRWQNRAERTVRRAMSLPLRARALGSLSQAQNAASDAQGRDTVADIQKEGSLGGHGQTHRRLWRLHSARFRWAQAIVQSRSFGLSVRGRDGSWHRAKCLVPWADLLNTAVARRQNVQCHTNRASTHFVCVVSRHVAPGEQLFASYGAHTPSGLLMSYGITLPPEHADSEDNGAGDSDNDGVNALKLPLAAPLARSLLQDGRLLRDLRLVAAMCEVGGSGPGHCEPRRSRGGEDGGDVLMGSSSNDVDGSEIDDHPLELIALLERLSRAEPRARMAWLEQVAATAASADQGQKRSAADPGGQSAGSGEDLDTNGAQARVWLLRSVERRLRDMTEREQRSAGAGSSGARSAALPMEAEHSRRVRATETAALQRARAMLLAGAASTGSYRQEKAAPASKIDVLSKSNREGAGAIARVAANSQAEIQRDSNATVSTLLAVAHHRALALRLHRKLRRACNAFADIAQGVIESNADIAADVMSWQRTATQSVSSMRASAPPADLVVPDALFNLGLLELALNHPSSAAGENKIGKQQQDCAVRACGATAAINASSVALQCFALAERIGHPEAPMLVAHVLSLQGLDDLALRASARAVCGTEKLRWAASMQARRAGPKLREQAYGAWGRALLRLARNFGSAASLRRAHDARHVPSWLLACPDACDACKMLADARSSPARALSHATEAFAAVISLLQRQGVEPHSLAPIAAKGSVSSGAATGILSSQPLRWALALSDMGNTLQRQGRYDDADRVFEQGNELKIWPHRHRRLLTPRALRLPPPFGDEAPALLPPIFDLSLAKTALSTEMEPAPASFPYTLYRPWALRRVLAARDALQSAFRAVQREARTALLGGRWTESAGVRTDEEQLHAGPRWQMLYFTARPHSRTDTVRGGARPATNDANDRQSNERMCATLESDFPQTLSTLRGIPDIAPCLLCRGGTGSSGTTEDTHRAHCDNLSAFLSLVRTRSRILPHCGPTNQRLRLHLPLIVPRAGNGSACCSMRVGGFPAQASAVTDGGKRSVRWEEGRVLAFDDAYEHDVRCSTGDGDCARTQQSIRLILVVDTVHPAAVHDQMSAS